MDRISSVGKLETIDALRYLGYERADAWYTQKSKVDDGYVLHKPDDGIIIIQEEKPRKGCVYDKYDDSTLDKVEFVIHCTARIGVETARSCCGLINDYEFIFAITDYEKFLNLVKSGREDFDWLIYNTYVDARNDDWPMTKTPYPAAIDITKWESVVGDKMLKTPKLQQHNEKQLEAYGLYRSKGTCSS